MSRQDLPILNLSEPRHKRLLLQLVKSLEGVHRVEITRVRDQRSLSQNAYYWGVVLPAAAAGMGEAWGYAVDAAEAHEFFKDRFLRLPLVNRNTGEVMGHAIRGTSQLDVAEFGEYLDGIIQFAAEQLGVAVPSPDEYQPDARNKSVFAGEKAGNATNRASILSGPAECWKHSDPALNETQLDRSRGTSANTVDRPRKNVNPNRSITGAPARTCVEDRAAR